MKRNKLVGLAYKGSRTMWTDFDIRWVNFYSSDRIMHLWPPFVVLGDA